MKNSDIVPLNLQSMVKKIVKKSTVYQTKKVKMNFHIHGNTAFSIYSFQKKLNYNTYYLVLVS